MRTLLLLMMMVMMYSTIANPTKIMRHITLDQLLQAHIDDRQLVSLCDSKSLEDLKENHLNILEEVNMQAVDEVYSYLRGVYAVPIIETSDKPIDPALRHIIGDMMVYRLHKRRDPAKLEYIQGNYKVCLDKLKDIRDGKMVVDIAKPAIEGSSGSNVLYKPSIPKFKF